MEQNNYEYKNTPNVQINMMICYYIVIQFSQREPLTHTARNEGQAVQKQIISGRCNWQ
jgi:hypothetical protein